MRNAIALVIGSLFFAGAVYAASPLQAQIEAPKSPTNQTDIAINVVVLDQNQVPSISVQCFWQKNGGPWNALGNVITVIPGGNNTANCQTSSNEISEDATYSFYATVNDGTNGMNTQTVSTNFTRSGPGTPTNYSKSQPTSCSNKISFHTADDGGKTVKVEVYRSTSTSFGADGSTKIGTVSIGSNLDGNYTDNVPDCNATYFYAIRAFDSAGNGSGVVGDSQTVTVVTTTTGASGTAGAIPAGTNGNVLGASNGTIEGSTGPSGGVLGEATISGTPTPTEVTPTPTPPVAAPLFNTRNVGIGGGLLVVILLLIFLFK